MKKIISIIFFISLSICNAVVAQDNTKSSSIVNIGGESFYVHTVNRGETLYSIATLYNTTEEEIVHFNPTSAGVLSIDMVIKVPFKSPKYSKREIKRRDKKFIKHTVLKGETAYSIAKQYGVPVNTLIEDNPNVEIVAIPLNIELNIRKNEIGESNHTEIKENLKDYTDNLNSVSDEYVYHVVKKEDTFFKLSKQYNISIPTIKSTNNILDNNLRLGAIVKVGKIDRIKKLEDAKKNSNQIIDTIKIESLFPANNGGIKEDIIANVANENTINIAMLIPILKNRQDVNFLEFYQGALIAIKSMKEMGVNVNLNLYNSDRSADKVQQIISNGNLDSADIIIGPIYETAANPVIKFAEQLKIPVVSPLAKFDNISSHILFQLAPDENSKYDKLSLSLLGDKNVIIIKAEQNDTTFLKEIQHILPQKYTTLQYNKSNLTSDINSALSPDKENIFIISASSPYRIDEILARISSVQNNKAARSISFGEISVIGTSKWAKYNNIDRNLFFKLNTKFISSYYTHKNNDLVSDFDKSYIAAFRSIPGQYAYRAYDAVKLFGNSVISRQNEILINAVNSPQIELLQMNYRFEKIDGSESISNTNWGLVKYNSDYTIDIE